MPGAVCRKERGTTMQAMVEEWLGWEGGWRR